MFSCREKAIAERAREGIGPFVTLTDGFYLVGKEGKLARIAEKPGTDQGEAMVEGIPISTLFYALMEAGYVGLEKLLDATHLIEYERKRDTAEPYVNVLNGSGTGVHWMHAGRIETTLGSKFGLVSGWCPQPKVPFTFDEVLEANTGPLPEVPLHHPAVSLVLDLPEVMGQPTSARWLAQEFGVDISPSINSADVEQIPVSPEPRFRLRTGLPPYWSTDLGWKSQLAAVKERGMEVTTLQACLWLAVLQKMSGFSPLYQHPRYRLRVECGGKPVEVGYESGHIKVEYSSGKADSYVGICCDILPKNER